MKNSTDTVPSCSVKSSPPAASEVNDLVAVMAAVWHSGNVVGRINEVILRRARLVLGWVTVFGQTNHHGV